MNSYGLFFRQEGRVIRLPVNPETLPLAREGNNSEYNVLKLGQIVIPRTPKLKRLSISSFFPGRPFSGVLDYDGFHTPDYYIRFFESAMKSKTPITYTPVRYYENGQRFMSDDNGFEALVSRFDTEERGGETGDFYYTLELVEYKDYSPSVKAVSRDAATGETVATPEPTRSIPAGQIVVGSVCTANGPYFASSTGDEPHGNGSGRRVKVSRIVDLGRSYPYHITTESGGALGWIKGESLQVIS